MSLSEIQNEIYKKDPDQEIFERGKSEFNPEDNPAAVHQEQTETGDEWKQKGSPIGGEEKKIIKKGAYVLGGLLLVIALVVGFFWVRNVLFSNGQVSVNLDGPTEVKSGNLAVYTIKYKNSNLTGMKNVVLRLSYPEDLKPDENPDFKSEGTMTGVFNLGEIKGKSEGQKTFNVRIYSPRGNLAKIKAELSYSPSASSTTYATETQLVVNVTSTPITLQLMAPQNISSGDEVNYLITYKNEGADKFDGVRVRIDYPDGLTFSSSDPKVSEGNNAWYLGTLSPGQEGRIVAVGKLQGNRDEVKTATVRIGTDTGEQFVEYNDREVQTKIVSSPLTISQTVNGLGGLVANPGDNLQFEINYRNEGAVGLRDAIVTERLDSPILDYTTLDINGGSYDSSTKTITWKAPDYKDLKNLAPGQGGTIRFSVKVKSIIPVNGSNDKNFVIASLAKIDSPDIPTPISMNKIISGNEMDIKLNSKLVLEVNGYYNDSTIPNSGPIPPKVDQETTYTIHLSVMNVSNDVQGVKVETSLPTAVSFTDVVVPAGQPFEYSERTNSIVWNLGNLPAGTGLISPKKEITFQVKIKPSADQAGNPAPLLNASTISGQDAFTGENLSAKVDGKTTYLLEDKDLGSNYRVTN